MNDRHQPTGQPAWIEQARTLLEESARDLDAATLSRLNRARQMALDGGCARTAPPWLLRTGLASACALLLAVAAWQPYRRAEPGTPATAASAATGAAAQPDADEASPEFYQDLEFYAWLDAQNQGNGG